MSISASLEPQVGLGEDELYGSAQLAMRLANLNQDIMRLGIESRIVYPGSSGDTTVAELFGYERVTHIDYDPHVMKVMAKLGFISFTGSCFEYAGTFASQVRKENRYDLLVNLMAPMVTPDTVDWLLKPGGYLVTDDLLAADMLERRGFAAHIPTPYDREPVSGRHFAQPARVHLYRSDG